MNLYRLVLHYGYETYLRCKLLLEFVVHYRKYKQSSYYPEAKLKSGLRQYADHLVHIIKYGEIDRFYYLYGFDVVDSCKAADYIDYRSFMKQRDRLNIGSIHNYTCILRDKSLFATIAVAYGLPAVKELGVFSNTGSSIENIRGGEIYSLLEKTPELFFKPIDAECGAGIFCVSLRGNTLYFDDAPISHECLSKKLREKNGRYLIQTRLVQHPEMNRLYAHSINTLRIVSVHNPKTGDIEILHSLLRVGAHGNIVDNWAKGGLAIAVDADGRLSQYGFYKPNFGDKAKCHPDSHVEFQTFVVPYYQEAIDMVKRFHRLLSGIHSIGWDVAISPQGPVFIEGNDNWEISLHQAFIGLKRKVKQLFIEY